MSVSPVNVAQAGFTLNRPSYALVPERDLPAGFFQFLASLHRRFSPRQQQIILDRKRVLSESLDGNKPTHHYPREAVRNGWKVELPEWCQDQRNQMTGPADDAELVVKMLNSGAPGVMLDLEDSTVNEWEHTGRGIQNVLAALAATLPSFARKRGKTPGIAPSQTVIFTRPRGLHIHQAGILKGE